MFIFKKALKGECEGRRAVDILTVGCFKFATFYNLLTFNYLPTFAKKATEKKSTVTVTKINFSWQ